MPTAVVVRSLVMLVAVGADRAAVGGGWIRAGPCRLRRCRRRWSVLVVLEHAVHYRVRSVMKEPSRSPWSGAVVEDRLEAASAAVGNPRPNTAAIYPHAV